MLGGDPPADAAAPPLRAADSWESSMKKPFAVVAVAVAATLSLAACNAAEGGAAGNGTTVETGSAAETESAAGAAPVTALNVMIMPVADAAPIYLAQDQGLFQERSVEVETTFVQNGAAAVAELMSGAGHIAYTSPVVVLNAQTKDVPLVLVCGSNAESLNPDEQLVALVAKGGSGLDSGADFSGTTIAVNALKAANELTTRVEIENMGGDPAAVTFTALNPADMVGAVERGQVDAAVVTEPFLTPALESGMEIVASIQAPYGEDGTASAYMATRDYVEENPDAVAGFCDAVGEASEFANANADAVREAIATYTEIPEEALAGMRLPTYSTNLKRETLDALADAMVAQGFVEARPDVDAVLWER
ncbi:hypothetical protein FE374_11420 [Georgenia yuyongxinii]|uniref:SsuA/THI5-like domain-containing protein n=1 Tax=Georgenia yuyongxinii TaxID=2589797 RepID=A0A5B8C332_9MICO|nr:hypothetical protein FE374_11420 [Georgenia yuyongxinii]